MIRTRRAALAQSAKRFSEKIHAQSRICSQESKARWRYPSRLVPYRAEARADTAQVLRQPRDRLAVVVIEADIERRKIGLLALGPRRLRDRGDAVLIQQPFQRHLRGRGV